MVYQYRDACGIFGDFIINVLKYVIKNSTRRRRGYIILIAGGALVVAGIAISAAWAGFFVGQFMQENTLIDQAVVGPSETINATLQVSRPIAMGLHIEPESANVILRETLETQAAE